MEVTRNEHPSRGAVDDIYFSTNGAVIWQWESHIALPITLPLSFTLKANPSRNVHRILAEVPPDVSKYLPDLLTHQRDSLWTPSFIWILHLNSRVALRCVQLEFCSCLPDCLLLQGMERSTTIRTCDQAVHAPDDEPRQQVMSPDLSLFSEFTACHYHSIDLPGEQQDLSDRETGTKRQEESNVNARSLQHEIREDVSHRSMMKWRLHLSWFLYL